MANVREKAEEAGEADRVVAQHGIASIELAQQRTYPRGTEEPPVNERQAPVEAAAPARPASGTPEQLLANADDEMRALYRRALWLGSLGHEPIVSLTPLFLAFLGGGTPFSDWVKTAAADLTLTPQSVLDGWRQLPNWYGNGIRAEHVRAPQAAEQIGEAISDRARAVLEAAAAFQARTGAPALGARHVFAALLLSPIGAEADFDAWQFRRRSWAARLAVFASQLAPGESWRAICVGDTPPRRSGRLDQVLATAAALAKRRGVATLDSEDLVRALLGCAAAWRAEKLTNVWLLRQLGDDALALLQVPDLGALGTPPPRGRRSDTVLPFTDEVAAWTHEAQLWALTCPHHELNLRHVVAALLSPRGPAAGRRMLRRTGCDPAQLARDLLPLVRSAEPDEDHVTWQWLLDTDVPQHDVARPGYANDVARGADLLSLGGEVRALASVLASVDTRPPLSVGLFGNWGSGKSFFMEMLREHIRALAERSGGARQSAYCAQIAQIEFNAWHYLDGDLWASLVSHLLDSLETYFRGDAQSIADRARAELATTQLKAAEIEKQQRELEARRAQFEARMTASDPTASEIADALAGKVTEEVKRRTAEAHPVVRKALDDVAARVGVAPGTLSLSNVRQQARAFRVWWKQLTPRKMVLGGAVLAIAAAASIAAARADQAILAAIAAATPAFAVITRIVQVGVPIAKAARRATAVGQEIANQIANNRPSAFQEHAQLEAEKAALDGEHARLAKRTQELCDELSKTKPPGMRDYVLDRAGQYRDRLGIVASVHRDFRNLSDQLRDDTTDPKLQRIILYIDDLDRCPPTRVVEMLQAIHLLLSFELFVVVVAVDPTWLTRSLEAYYAQQFAGCGPSKTDREARPQFYLEKIFQIPYALQPMSARRFGSMVDGLLKPALVAEPVNAAPAASHGLSAPHPRPMPASTSVASPAPAVASAPAPVIDLMPRNLQITAAELANLRTLGPLVASPRATKRLTNLYRIVRAGLTGDALDEFIDSGYPLTQTLLAAVVGCPEVVVTWLEQILGQATGDIPGLLAPLEKLAARGTQEKFLHDRVRACLEPSPGGGRALTWQRTIEVCKLAARYSFETGALLELVPA